MIEIDGSDGEGGGSIVRIATALSALSQETINIKNIRSNRPKTGLMPQHLNAVKVVAQLSHASCDKLEIGSNEIFFKPESIKGGNFEIDIKTAGSIALVLQAFMIPAFFAKSRVNITICGGTDVRWSPSINYLQNITLPILKTMGYVAEIDIIRRGHYPRGGGIVKVEIAPVKKLKPIISTELEVDRIRGISHSVKIPEHVAVRQAESAEKVLKANGFDAEIEIEHSNNALGAGSGIVLWSEGKSRVGGSSIGERGLKAENVGKNAAKEILYHISKGAAVDKYMGDQLIPYMAIKGNSKIKTAELTLHTLTNIHVAEKIMDKKFSVIGELGDIATISVI
ncbi:MAG: RNA 3'-terminal phosphate cyclase [Methanobacterium sp.]|uniref:RNA 3'-terminal phosphate cyclase n=1 Tax=Methanobacterium sp. TaxID=2164 RepID=UPI003D65A324|nr:RNA 3'-terminal phosphate cyclase [Methanobacterium sp.]